MECKKMESFRKILLLFFSFAGFFAVKGQDHRYTVSNAHSHNDYEQRIPFRMAYQAGFGSIEADIFLVDTVLYVAHDSTELQRKIKLETAYIIPIWGCLKNNNGRPYPDSGKKLQILIDIKSDSIHALQAFIILLRKYPSLISSRSVKWLITGNRPDESLFTAYPGFIQFDGELNKNYSKEALSRIGLMSDNFKHYSLWSGQNNLSEKDFSILKSAVNKAHRLSKPVRFWNAPDEVNAWNSLMQLQVDYINTDHIDSLADFLNKNRH